MGHSRSAKGSHVPIRSCLRQLQAQLGSQACNRQLAPAKGQGSGRRPTCTQASIPDDRAASFGGDTSAGKAMGECCAQRVSWGSGSHASMPPTLPAVIGQRAPGACPPLQEQRLGVCAGMLPQRCCPRPPLAALHVLLT